MAFVDTSTNNFQISAFGNAQISTSVFKYGGGSALFDGNGDYLQTIIPDTVWNIGVSNQPFTIELWVYRLTSGTQVFVSKHGGVNAWNGTNGLNFNFYYTGTALLFEFWGTSGVQAIVNTVSIPTNQWVHLAATYDGTTTRIFVNGVLQGTTSTANYGTTTSANIFEIGAQISGSFPFNGYIDGLRITKGVARYITNFVPPTVAMQTFTDPYYNNVVLLLPMNPGPLVDSSTNNFTLSAFGNADISRTVTKYGNYSGYFDGNGDYLQLSAINTFTFGTDNFTLECWIRPNTNPAPTTGIATLVTTGHPAANDAQGLFLGITSSRALYWLYSTGGGWITPSGSQPSTVISDTDWTHIAYVRSGNLGYLFANGVLVSSGSITGSLTNTSNNLVIGGRFSSANQDYAGYIDDLRITNGVARYTTTFTPPQQQLPAPTDPFADNVSLLLHMDGLSGTQTFIDSSSNNFALLAFNNAQIATTVRRYGSGSAYFNGTNDYLRINNPPASLINWFDSDFTIETWVYLISAPSNTPSSSSPLIGNADIFTSIEYWAFGPTNSRSVKFKYWSGAENGLETSAAIINTGQWYHLAFVKSGAKLSIYVDGVERATQTLSVTPLVSNLYPLAIGSFCNASFNGYIDDLRVTKGVARYTANFTPPTAPFPNPVAIDPYDGSVSLLLRMNGDNGSQTFLDSSTNKFPITTFGNAQISTAVKKFGTGSGYFDGTGDYLELPLNAAFDFGSDDFTIELWAYPTTARFQALVARWGNGGNAIFLGMDTSTNNIQLYLNNSAAVFGGTPQINQWNHIAAVREGSNVRLFLNGVQVGSTFNIGSTAITSTTERLRIGDDNNVGNPAFLGYLDDVRITKGVARYTSNFTPPTAPSPNPINLVPPGYIAFWKLNGLTDSSNNSNTLTNNGSVRFIPGLLGDCAQFTGSNSVYLQDSPISPAFNPSETFTVSLWVYPRSFTNYQAFIGGPANSFIIHTDNAGNLYCNNAATADAQVNGALQLNTWQHIVMIVGSNRTKAWVNGVNRIDKTKGVTYSSTTNVVLGNFGGLNFPYDGLLDCVGLWNRELTQGEITQLYNTGLGLEP